MVAGDGPPGGRSGASGADQATSVPGTAAPGGTADGTTDASPYARSEARNQAVRDSLVPLRKGERPRAVTVAAIVALLSALANTVAYLAGFEVGGERPSAVYVVLQAAVLLIAAWGMWRVRYWAVLGMQALLALTLISVALFVFVQATLIQAALLTLLVLAPAGALFWFLVRAMARIQMPERRR